MHPQDETTKPRTATETKTPHTVLEGLFQKKNDAAAEFYKERARQIEVNRVKQARVDLDAVLQNIKTLDNCGSSPELSNAAHYITNATMWLGLELKALGEANPYPNSRDTTSPVVDPVADGLKF